MNKAIERLWKGHQRPDRFNIMVDIESAWLARWKNGSWLFASCGKPLLKPLSGRISLLISPVGDLMRQS